MASRCAVIIGAGPAGLTAASELLARTDIRPVVFEATGDIGGISKTIDYKGNRIDIGGHRFFSKSDRVLKFWDDVLPRQGKPARDDLLLGRSVPLSNEPGAPDPEKTDRVMLVRRRMSRIFFHRRFFDYPISLGGRTVMRLGLGRTLHILGSYVASRLCPEKEERTLEQFLVNRFGRELYLTFFKDYTEKVWGTPCDRIPAEWGRQRIKGLSIGKAVAHAARKLLFRGGSLDPRGTETSLIERFLYPKLGPGQLWEEVARRIEAQGGEVHLRRPVVGFHVDGNRLQEVLVRDPESGQVTACAADVCFSSMPVKDLVEGLGPCVPPDVREVAGGLVYRDFITVGLLVKSMRLKNETKIKTVNNIIPDNWIYIQEKDVRLGRLQIFNNWSPYMVKDENTVWLGLEYFCSSEDPLWHEADGPVIDFAAAELAKLGMIRPSDVLDGVVIRVPKAYPAYFGTYDRIDTVRGYLDRIENLFLIGRNGMHRYNNQDHSMLTAMVAVDNLVNNVANKAAVWAVNTEEEYHEAR
jgi:protoporphyrinogen oxidase